MRCQKKRKKMRLNVWKQHKNIQPETSSTNVSQESRPRAKQCELLDGPTQKWASTSVTSLSQVTSWILSGSVEYINQQKIWDIQVTKH